MKKWMIVTLFALLALLLLCAACAEDGHNWVWEYNDKTHTRCCNGCATHSNKKIDEASSGTHTYTCEWPQSESNGGQGVIYLDLVCECGKRVKVEAQPIGGTNATCTNTGSHTYEYKGGSEYTVTGGRSKTYTVPQTSHEFKNYTRNNNATCTQNETETALCIYNCNTTDTRDIPNSALRHDPEQHPAKAATCTESGCNAYETCKRAGCDYTTYQEIPALDHKTVVSYTKAPTCTEGGFEFITCTREGCTYTTRMNIAALDHDLEQHDAKAPTCTEPGYAAYETCKRDGCDYTTYQEIPATGHTGTKQKVIKPTCEKSGYTEYTCDVCGEKYTGQRKNKLLHWFGAWTSNGDGTHSAACKRDGCDHIGKTDCAMQEIKLGDATIAYCPVCGDAQDGKTFALIEGAQAKALTKRLPQGEVVLRTLAWTDDATLLSAGFEYAGKLTQPTGAVEFTLPAALIEGKTLSTLNADGAQEILACTIDGDTAAFTLDFTDSKNPVQLIYVTPAA